METLNTRFDAPTDAQRAHRLLPFMWSQMIPQGQFMGDKRLGHEVKVTNPYWFSYPGYNEILTGSADRQIATNDFGQNPNLTVWEWLSKQKGLQGEVAVYGTWDEFHNIFRDAQSGLTVIAGQNIGSTQGFDHRRMEQADISTSVVDVEFCASDAQLMTRLREDLKKERPKLLFVGLGDTDTWAHMGRYDEVIESLHRDDGYIKELWEAYQSDPKRRDKTTFIVTTDHGRGASSVNWTEHWNRIEGSDDIWMMWRGPSIDPMGNRFDAVSVTQSQIAATIAALLGKSWQEANPHASAAIRFESRVGSTPSTDHVVLGPP
jgi:hypothetical protein